MKNKTTRKKSTRIAALALLATTSGIAPSVQAADLFSVTTTAPSVTPVTKSNSDLEKLIRDAIQSRDQFQPFLGLSNVNSTLNWGGVPNALIFNQTESAGIYTGVLTSSVLPGFQVTRQATSQDNLGDEFANFFKKDGAGLYTDLLKAISATSKVSPTDGNPNADTARNASNDYNSGAKVSGETKAEKKSNAAAAAASGFRVDADLGTFTANGIQGRTFALPLSKRFVLSERVKLDVGLPLSYSTIGNATIYSVGLNLGFPTDILKKANGQPISWRVTPFGGASATASREMLLGGAILRGGISNLVAYDFGKFEVAIGNQISQHSSMELDIAGTKVDPGVDQQILKNGVQICVPLAQHWIVEGYVIHTNFLAAAGVKQYLTYGGDVGYRIMETKDAVSRFVGTLRVGAYVDSGSGFTGAHFRIGSNWKF